MSACLLTDARIEPATTPAQIETARRLFRTYADWLAVDLCYQNFDEELRTLPGAYAPPAGRLLLARVAGEFAGCVALRPLEPGISEMKRLWVEPGFGGRGLGRALVERVLAEAQSIGYGAVRLDTLPDRLKAAQHLYQSLGFQEIPAYYANPTAGVMMMELRLERAAR